MIGKNAKNHKETLIVFLLLCITYGFFYTHGGYNQNSRLALTFSIVENNSLSLNATDVEDPVSILFTEDLAIVNGRNYSDKAIGSSLAAALAYYPISLFEKTTGINLDVTSTMHLLTFIVIGLPSALTGTLIYNFCKYLSKKKTSAFIVTAAISVGTICFPFSTTFFGHQLTAFYLFASFYLIFQLKNLEKPVKFLRLFLIGLLMGLAIQTEYTSAIIVLPLIVYYFIVIWQTGQIKKPANTIFPFLGGLLPIAVVIIYNQIVFGGIFNIGYQYLANPYFQEAMSKGLMGIGRPNLMVLFYETLHPTYGVFWLSPVLLMIFVGAFYMLRSKQNRLELFFTFLFFGSYLLINSGYYMWWGGNSLGPRAIIPALPFLCIPLIFVPKKWNLVLIVLTMLSVFQMTLAASSNFLVPEDNIATIATDPFFSYSLIYDDCLAQLLDGRFSWNIGQNLFGLTGFASLLPLFLIQILLTMIFFMNPIFMAHKVKSGIQYRIRVLMLRHKAHHS